MKTLKGIFLIAIMICWNNCNGIAAQPVKSSAEGFVFTHPVLLNSKVNDKAQTVSVIKPDSNPKGVWTAADYTESGTYVREKMRIRKVTCEDKK